MTTRARPGPLGNIGDTLASRPGCRQDAGCGANVVCDPVTLTCRAGCAKAIDDYANVGNCACAADGSCKSGGYVCYQGDPTYGE